MSSLVRELALGTAGTLLLALSLAGLGTGAALHLRQVQGLDQMLLAVAHGQAHPEAQDGWEVEHSRAPVETWIVTPGEGTVPEAWARAALEAERPAFHDAGGQRLLLLPAEASEEGDDGDDGDDDTHMLIAAVAPAVELRQSVGPFALAYVVVAALTAFLAGGLQAHLVRRALRPLLEARETSARVVRLGQGTRLPVQGPVEIQGLLLDLNALLDRLDEAFQAQARFTAEAAHELRTPVTALLGEIEVALRRPRSPEGYVQTLGALHGDVERLRALVEALLLLARLDTGQLDAAREPVRAGEVLQAALRAEGAALQAAGCTVEVKLSEDPELLAHPALLIAAVGNLLRNAAAYAPGTPVRVAVEVRPLAVAFVVEDGGPGIPPAERQAVFDRFARLGPGRRDHPEGLGLGLPLAREVARRHGGDCQIEDSPRGCRVRLTIFQSPPEGG